MNKNYHLGFLVTLIIAFSTLQSCAQKKAEIISYFPRPVLANQDGMNLFMVDKNRTQKFYMSNTTVREPDADKPSSEDQPKMGEAQFGVYLLSPAKHLLREQKKETPKSFHVVRLSNIMYIELLETHNHEEGGKVISQTYNKIVTKDLRFQEFGKFYGFVLTENGLEQMKDCEIYPYSPDMEDQIKNCGEGLFVFVYPPWLTTNSQNADLYLVIDEITHQESNIVSERFVYKKSQVDLDRIPAEISRMEVELASASISKKTR